MKIIFSTLAVLGILSSALTAQTAPVAPTPTALPPTADLGIPDMPPPADPAGTSALEPVEPMPIDPPAMENSKPGLAPGMIPGLSADPGAGISPSAAGLNPVLPSDVGGAPSAGVPVDPNAMTARDFQNAEVPQVLRLLARQAKLNMVVSSQVQGTLTMRLENTTALDAIRIIINSQGLIMDEVEGVYYVKTLAEKAAEPTESAFYNFSYAKADAIAPLLASQLASGVPPQFDPRTNTIFYRETRSNLDSIKLFLKTVDVATKQVMIEARLVEVTANPKQSYGINWAGVLGGSASPQTFRYGGSSFINEDGSYDIETTEAGTIKLNDFGVAANPTNAASGFDPTKLIGDQFAILSVPQMSATLRLLNEDSDAEFLANPRVVTADNQQATIKITRNQPVPQLNFNEQTATAVFGGFEDKLFGNTLIVTPSINKDSFVTLKVEPEISNKVGDETFTFAGAVVKSPIIDTRKLESNVLIRSGDTLAIGGLLQDESLKGSSKVPVLGDIPILGYLFQEKLKARSKRNLLVFVTPTIIEQGYGTGLEDQVGGLHNSGEEFADPNGWRNNAKGSFRLIPTSQEQLVSEYPKPGTPIKPRKVQYKGSAPARE